MRTSKRIAGNSPPYGRIWTIFFLYSAIVAVFIQLVALRYWVPENWEVVQGLLIPDSQTYHKQAQDMAQRIKAEGWSMWQLRPKGEAPVGITAVVYTFCGSRPWMLIPLNALLHATSGLLILLSLQFLLLNWRYALLCSLPFLLFPTPITWYAQIHKDGWSIAGMAMILYGTLSLIAGESRADKPYVFWWSYPLMIVGIFFIYLARPYLMPIYQVVLAVVLLLYLVVCLRRFGRKNYFVRFTVVFCGIGGAILLMSLLESDWITKIYSEAIASAAHNPKFDNRIIADVPAVKNRGVGHGSPPGVQSIFAEKMVAAKPGLDKFKWHDASWLPKWLNHKLRRLSLTRTRWIISYSDAASSIDQEVFFASPQDMINYLPRAAQIAFLAPFPSFWLGKGSLPENTLMRRVVAFETAFVYLALSGIVLAFFYWWKRLELWCILVFCCLPMLVYAMAVINIGSLYRMRYGFLTVLVALGCAGTLKFLGDRGIWYAKKKTGQS
ncbi:MAG: hypothetical protein KJP23_31850 [Deltaproteobacteria bacterium]|nr:hypothetical protein [Deltaproteobacteria bacterium]